MSDSAEAWEWLERIAGYLDVDTEELIELPDSDFWYVFKSYHKKDPTYNQRRSLSYWKWAFSD